MGRAGEIVVPSNSEVAVDSGISFPEVSLNERVVALATVLCDGHIKVLQADPLVAMLPPASKGGVPVNLRCFPFDETETTVVEISVPIAFNVPFNAAIDNWALRRANGLFNVYILREESNADGVGSVLKAQSSILASNLSLSVFGLTVHILTGTAPRLAHEFRERFTSPHEPKPRPAGAQPPYSPLPSPIGQAMSVEASASGAGPNTAMPGYL